MTAMTNVTTEIHDDGSNGATEAVKVDGKTVGFVRQMSNAMWRARAGHADAVTTTWKTRQKAIDEVVAAHARRTTR